MLIKSDSEKEEPLRVVLDQTKEKEVSSPKIQETQKIQTQEEETENIVEEV